MFHNKFIKGAELEILSTVGALCVFVYLIYQSPLVWCFKQPDPLDLSAKERVSHKKESSWKLIGHIRLH